MENEYRERTSISVLSIEKMVILWPYLERAFFRLFAECKSNTPRQKLNEFDFRKQFGIVTLPCPECRAPDASGRESAA